MLWIRLFLWNHFQTLWKVEREVDFRNFCERERERFWQEDDRFRSTLAFSGRSIEGLGWFRDHPKAQINDCEDL